MTLGPTLHPYGRAPARRFRLDSAAVLSRFFFLEEALVRACAGWIPALHRLETKTAVARLVWQDALTADALRERVFELRYPSRLLELGADAPLAALFRAAANAPSAQALLRAVAEVLNPALLGAYRNYLAGSDEVADAPTARFLQAAILDKEEQQDVLAAAGASEPALPMVDGQAADHWVAELRGLLARLGGIHLDPVSQEVTVPAVIPPGRPFELAQQPPRDDRYHGCRYYWPDVVDPAYPYGEGLALQVRSAVSHLNEVWAVETAGALLSGLAEPLGWEFVRDASRWLYDEARHMTMGQRRLDAWGLPRAEIPLGDYIYHASHNQDLIYRLGMLGYFEAKNIGRKQTRARAFHEMGDAGSQLHMEFDWADETLHAEYGRRWLRRLLEVRGQDPADWSEVIGRCEELVAVEVAAATEAERTEIRALADHLLERAQAAAAG